MIVVKKTQYCQHVILPNNIYSFHAVQIKITAKLFCRYGQTDSKVFIKRQYSQHNTEGKKQSWRSDTN